MAEEAASSASPMSAGALFGRQFDMRPNIKATPGSQGTLFQAPTPGRNWPRHYTPERQDEVMRGLGRKRDNTSTSPKWGPPVNTTFTAEHPGVAAENRFATDTLARSTVPVEHLEGLHPHYSLSAGQYVRDQSEAGHYNTHGVGGTRKEPKLPNIVIAQGHARSATVVHEVGHHVSATIDRNEHAQYDTPSRRGTEEGYAENYSDTHFRDVRGRPQHSQTPSYAWSVREKEMRGADPWAGEDFDRAFKRKRSESPLHPKQFDWNSREARGLPKEHVEGQLPLLDRITTGGSSILDESPKQTTWDYAEGSGLPSRRRR